MSTHLATSLTIKPLLCVERGLFASRRIPKTTPADGGFQNACEQ